MRLERLETAKGVQAASQFLRELHFIEARTCRAGSA